MRSGMSREGIMKHHGDLFVAVLVLALALVGCTSPATPAPTELPTALPTAAPSPVPTEVWLHQDLGAGEAVVWYLGHCGYAIRTQHHFLIFDYQEQYDGSWTKLRPAQPALANGFIVPAEIADQAVRVFVTHSHTDHFSRVIFQWKDKIPDIAYYFGWEAASDPSYHYLVGPRAQLQSTDLEVYTINSHHSGVPEVAYLVKVDGLVIYHNGDYLGDYQADYPYLRELTARIDLSFVLRGFEDGSPYLIRNTDLFERFDHGAVFPTHDSAQKGQYAEFKKVVLATFPDLPLLIPRRTGERFLFRNGQISRDGSPSP